VPVYEGVYVGSRVGVLLSPYGLGCGWDDREVPELPQAVFYDVATATRLAVNAEQLIEKIDRNLFERMGDVQAFTLNPLSWTGDQEVLESLADSYTNLYDCYDLMVIADAATGKVIATNRKDLNGDAITGPSLVGTDVGKEPWFKACLGTVADTWWQGPHQEPLVTSAKPAKRLRLMGSFKNTTAPKADKPGTRAVIMVERTGP
jgi:hypothetical protein